MVRRPSFVKREASFAEFPDGSRYMSVALHERRATSDIFL
jgi:hypothetical protein